MYEMVQNMIKPEYLVLVPGLYFLGVWLKKSSVADKHIPWILGCTGIVICMAWTAATISAFDWQSILLGAVTAAVQGVLCAGASVYVNQVVKQAGKEE